MNGVPRQWVLRLDLLGFFKPVLGGHSQAPSPPQRLNPQLLPSLWLPLGAHPAQPDQCPQPGEPLSPQLGPEFPVGCPAPLRTLSPCREQPIFSTRAHVFQIDPATKRNWIPAGKHALTVSYFYDATRNVYRIISIGGAKVLAGPREGGRLLGSQRQAWVRSWPCCVPGGWELGRAQNPSPS